MLFDINNRSVSMINKKRGYMPTYDVLSLSLSRLRVMSIYRTKMAPDFAQLSML